MRSYPYIIAYANRPCIFKSAISLLHIKRMSGGIKPTTRSNEHIITELNFCFVQNNTVHIGIKIFANLYIITIITEERLFYQEIMPRFSE